MFLGWVQLSITFLKGQGDTKTSNPQKEALLIAQTVIRHTGTNMKQHDMVMI